MIQKAAIPDADDVGDLRRKNHAGVASRCHTWRNCLPCRDQFFKRHRLRTLIGVILESGYFELLGETTDSLEDFLGPSGACGPAKHRRALPISGVVALCSRNHLTVRHHPSVAGVASHGAQLKLALAADHPSGEWDRAILRDGHAGLFEELGIAH